MDLLSKNSIEPLIVKLCKQTVHNIVVNIKGCGVYSGEGVYL